MTARDPLVGSVLAGRYKVGRFVGEGRMGRIYIGHDKQAKRKVALKLLHPQLCNVEDQVRRFEREFHVTSQIAHPNSVEVYAFEAFEDRRFLVLEFLEGKGLDTLLGDGRKMDFLRAVRIASQIASALAAAHAQGVIHRDLNPTNVMLCKVGGRPDQVKVLDFGLARLEGSTEEITGVGERLGTAKYMAPEYIEDTGLDHRSDLYGLGCVFFEMLTGAPPFVGPALRVLEAQVNQPAPSPSSRVPGLPDWLDELALSLLEKDPDARPQSAQEVVETLEAGARKLEAERRRQAETADNAPSHEMPPPVAPSGMGHGTGSFAVPKRRDRTDSQPIFVAKRQPRWVLPMLIATFILVLSSLAGTLLTWWLLPG